MRKLVFGCKEVFCKQHKTFPTRSRSFWGVFFSGCISQYNISQTYLSFFSISLPRQQVVAGVWAHPGCLLDIPIKNKTLMKLLCLFDHNNIHTPAHTKVIATLTLLIHHESFWQGTMRTFHSIHPTCCIITNIGKCMIHFKGNNSLLCMRGQ